MRAFASLLAALVVGACSEQPSPPEPPVTSPLPASTVASVLEPGAIRPGTSPRPAPPMGAIGPTHAVVAPGPVEVHVVRLTVGEGEDGHGHTVAAVRPAAIDLVTDGGWHGGALATTLTIGDLRFHNMGYPSITTMRFIVADEGTLPRDAEVALEVGAATERRRVLAPSLPVIR